MRKPLLLGLSLLAACTDAPISYSDEVGIALKANVVDGMVLDDKNINTESGNPYAAFISDARAALGKDPGAIEVDRIELAVSGGTVTQLGEVFGGDVEVLFEINDGNTRYVVGSATILPGLDGPQQLDIAFSSAAVTSADYPRLVGGGFKVITTGPAAAGFDGKAHTADLEVRFNFAAFE